VKDEGLENDLLARLAGDPAFAAVKGEIPSLADAARHIGRAPSQVTEFLDAEVEPVLARHRGAAGLAAELRV
jgi:adenylosuccinate lyase